MLSTTAGRPVWRFLRPRGFSDRLRIWEFATTFYLLDFFVLRSLVGWRWRKDKTACTVGLGDAHLLDGSLGFIVVFCQRSCLGSNLLTRLRHLDITVTLRSGGGRVIGG